MKCRCSLRILLRVLTLRKVCSRRKMYAVFLKRTVKRRERNLWKNVTFSFGAIFDATGTLVRSTSILFTKMTVKKLSRQNIIKVERQCSTAYCIWTNINNTDVLCTKISKIYAGSRYKITCVWLLSFMYMKNKITKGTQFFKILIII